MFAEGFGDGFGFGMDLQLFVNVAQVERKRVEGNTNHILDRVFLLCEHQKGK